MLIPTTESTVIVETPEATGAVTVLILVTSPRLRIGSLTVTLVEFTSVVVPSTCRSPLMITVPSLLRPSGNGSMNSWLPLPDLVEIVLDEIPTLPNV